MPLRIDRVEVGYTIETDTGPERKLVTLAALWEHCRRERVEDLLDDLQVLCEDVQDAREPDSAQSRGTLRSVK